MARASTRTLLSLDRFAKIIGMNPLHFNQVIDNQDDPTSSERLAPAVTCGMPLVQYAWQRSDAIGREELAQVIADAEAAIEREICYSVAPKWIAEELVVAPRLSNPQMFNMWSRDLRGFWNAFNLGSGYVISGGIEAWSAIQNGAAVVYTDVDGDGYKETATIVVPTTVTDPAEISLHYPGMMGAAIQDTSWEVRPIAVSITAGVATITCRREQLVKPELMEGLVTLVIDGQLDADFLATADVWRHYNDPSLQAQLLWESSAGNCDCGFIDCASCAAVQQTACLLTRNARLGLVAATPGAWDAASSSFTYEEFSECRGPDRARVYYLAGWRDMKQRLPNIQMDPMWERAVSYLTLSMLDRPLCSCESLRAYTAHWADDLAANSSSSNGGSQSYSLSSRTLDCPLGTTRGALYAWSIIKRDKIGEAVVGR